MRTRGFRRLRDSKGATLVEAAIITPLLLLLTFSAIDFAALFFVDLSLQNGVNQATRFAVTGNLMQGLSRENSIRTAMRQSTPTLTLRRQRVQLQPSFTRRGRLGGRGRRAERHREGHG